MIRLLKEHRSISRFLRNHDLNRLTCYGWLRLISAKIYFLNLQFLMKLQDVTILLAVLCL
jgi:hypothetical protein